MFPYTLDRDSNPHKKINGTMDKAIVPISEMIENLRYEVCTLYPTAVTKPENVKKVITFCTYKTNYLRSIKADKNFPYDKALQLVKDGFPLLHTYKDYYRLYESSAILFTLVKILYNNKEYRHDIFDLMIPFTKDELFEIYLVDRKAYQQIIRGFYAIYGYDFRKYQLPFMKKYTLEYLPGLLFYHELNKYSIDPYDPCINSFSDKVNTRAVRCMSPDIFAIPAYYIHLAIKNCYFAPDVADWYSTCLEIGEPVLFYNDVIDYDYYKSTKLHPVPEFKYDKNLVAKYSNYFNPRPECHSDNRNPIWYGFAYFLADTAVDCINAKNIATAAMENPSTGDYSKATLEPLAVEYRYEYENAADSRSLLPFIILSAIIIILAIVFSLMFKFHTKETLIAIGILLLLIYSPVCIWALFQPTSHRHSSNNGPGRHYPAESSDFNSSDSLSWYGYSLNNVDYYNHSKWTDYYKINEYYNETK